MPAPGEHKTVQARILHYAQAIGWTYVPRGEAEARRGFKAEGLTSAERARGAALFLNDTLYAQVKKLNPRFAGSMGDVTGRLYALKPDIFGNREMLDYLRGRKTFYYKPENRELDLVLIDFVSPENNVYEVTEEFYCHNGHYGIVKDIALLKTLFKSKMETEAPQYLALIKRGFIDKDVDTLIEHFRDAERRKTFFKEYKEIEMLYEIISPDAFLRPYIDDYTTLSAIYGVVARAYTKRVYVDREFQKKTNELVQSKIDVSAIAPVSTFIEIDEHTIARIKENAEGDNTKVINLIKSIEKYADENSDDPLLIGMADRAQQVQLRYESRQESTQEALDELLALVKKNEQRKREQAEKGFDGLTYFVYRSLLDAKLANAEATAKKIKAAFVAHPNWTASEAELREVRKQVTFAIAAEIDDLDHVAALVVQLFDLLTKAYKLDR